MTDQAKQTDDTSVNRADTAVLRLTIGATVAALALSFRNQIDFATQRGGYPVWGAILWALIIDTPVIVGELRLYSAAARSEPEGLRIKAWAWTLTICGLLISMSAGAAHVTIPASFPVKVLAAVIPPLMAAASLGTGLGIVKLRNRSPGGSQPTQDASARPVASRARQPGKRKARAGQPDVAQLVALVKADQDAGLPVGRVAIMDRHGVSEHYARTVAQLVTSNGQEPAIPRS